MNLRDLNIFVAVTMDNKLAEYGIGDNQITQIKILDRKLPSDDNVVWMLRPKEHGFNNLIVIHMLQRWVITQIFMDDNLDRDLAIEIMGNGKGMMAI